MTPFHLGIEMAVAFCLATRTHAVTRHTVGHSAWHAIMLGVVAAGVVTCLISDAADTWWTKYTSYFDREVARVVNQSAAPLVLAGGPIALLGLSHLARPSVTLALARGAFEPPARASFSDVFVFSPSEPWLRSLRSHQDVELRPIFEQGRLWRLERSADARP